MGKRVALAIFGGIALLGVIVMIVGVSLGGRPGAIRLEDGSFVYASARESLHIGTAPYWMRHWGRSSGAGGQAASGGHSDGSHSGGGHAAVSAPLPEGQALTGLEVDISAGYVVIQTGSEPGLVVEGDMPYRATVEGGVWHIETEVDTGITSFGAGRFWLEGRDITTTFTITVPARLHALEIELGMGETTVSGITADTLECKVDLGSLTLRDVQAPESTLTVNLGSIEARGFSADHCTLSCDMGSINLSGSVASALSADCSLGSVYALLERPDGYTLEADVSMGSIQVDGASYGLGANRSNTVGSGATRFDLECGMGSIEIDFS